VFTQLPAHFEKPVLHAKPQLPLVHVGVPFGTAGHALLHEPQFAGSVLVATQTPPHLTKPALHAKPQPPAEHVGTALAGAVHSFPQAPQLFGSAEVSMH
jgi:hypothetical protein